MDDIATANFRLTQLKTRLEQKELELQALAESSDQDRQTLDTLISRLMLACRGLDRELDNRMARLKPHLEKHTAIEQINDDINAIELLLTRFGVIQEQLLQRAGEQVKSNANELIRNAILPEKVRREAREFAAQETPYTFGEHQQRIFRLLEIYQMALRALMLRPNEVTHTDTEQSSTTAKSAIPTTYLAGVDDIALSLSSIDPGLLTKIHDELQRLITELDFQGPTGEKLAGIRRQLLNGINCQDLPALCLELVALIIEGARYERAQSYAFVHTISEKLQLSNADITSYLDTAKELAREEQGQDQKLTDQIRQMRQSVAENNSLDELKRIIPAHLLIMDAVLQERSLRQRREQELMDQITLLTEQLKNTEEDAINYKNRLNRQQQRLQVDTLTQLHNRSALDERLALEYKRWMRYQSPLCLAIVDVDHFKLINDQFGHLAGDKALKVIARALGTALRDTDFVARFGGEEFVVLLPGINENAIQLPLDKLRNVIKGIPFRFKDERISISISIGATLFRSGDRITDAFERADKALYEAKNSGRDRIVITL
ncbi:GGDEF domain-containing protein [Tolumonas lignilytica]|uniref:GGDEF domain-containing protein n=1 Tax=Tolumonas lignilytica TaxID=1283284 RepID=UPI000463B89D|nr:GGDEF domain-containing protein [Tolumonas lignilytica]